jgi:hypothetical protein
LFRATKICRQIIQPSQLGQLDVLPCHHAEKNTTPRLLKARHAGRVTSLFAPLGKRGGTYVRQAQYPGRPATTLSGQSLISGQISLTSLDPKSEFQCNSCTPYRSGIF